MMIDRNRIDQPLNMAPTMKRRLEDAGFVDVRDDAYKVGFSRTSDWFVASF
jgi:hypothetical protein